MQHIKEIGEVRVFGVSDTWDGWLFEKLNPVESIRIQDSDRRDGRCSGFRDGVERALLS